MHVCVLSYRNEEYVSSPGNMAPVQRESDCSLGLLQSIS
jgi:hypothetical protein